MTPAEQLTMQQTIIRVQELTVQALFEKLLESADDPVKLQRAVYAGAHATNCPSAMRFPPVVLAEKLQVSRQAVHKMVDKYAIKIAVIKGDCKKRVDSIYP